VAVFLNFDAGTCLAQIGGVSDTVRLPIAYVMTSFEPGGTERQMIELVRRLDPHRWTVHVACFRARGAWFDRVAGAVESVTEFPVHSFKSPDVFRHMWAFAQWCRARRIAIVHTTEMPANIFGLPAAALAQVAVRIGNRREINPDKSTSQLTMQRVAYSFAHKVVANSRAAAERLLLERVPAHKVAVVSNGLDSSQTQPRVARTPLRKVIVVANLRQEKGHDVLIDAAVDVLRRVPDARFEIVGAGPLLAELVARAEARRVKHAFTFLGHRDDVPARLADADIFVLPSRSEAFPNAVLEAMAAGLPIVASAVGGIVELIDDDRTGLLVPAGDAAALGDRLCRLMTQPTLASRLGDAARQSAHARYSFDRMVAAFESLYLTELARRGVIDAQPELAAS
jgi:glycosyltransferase involved in cell wall biosynthesis